MLVVYRYLMGGQYATMIAKPQNILYLLLLYGYCSKQLIFTILLQQIRAAHTANSAALCSLTVQEPRDPVHYMISEVIYIKHYVRFAQIVF